MLLGVDEEQTYRAWPTIHVFQRIFGALRPEIPKGPMRNLLNSRYLLY